MTPPQPRKPRPLHSAEVVRRISLTPHMTRVVLGGDGLAEFSCGEHTDHYVKFVFCHPSAPDVDLESFDPSSTDLPREHWPVTRTYTVRDWDAAAQELTIDFVTHGDEGLAGPWAAKAEPGDRIWFRGPGGAYSPDETADWHFLVGDDSALPAIAAAWERLPSTAVARAIIEVPDSADELDLEQTDTKRVTWVHRGAAPVGVGLVKEARDTERLPGRVHAFIHGEANAVKDLRRLLFKEWGVDKADASISGYWRTGDTEDQWQAGKRAWLAEVEAAESQQ